MTPDEIREVFDGFIECPEGSEKLYVTTASTLIFARHIAKIVAEREREACANLAQQYAGQVGDVAWTIAGEIRARSRA